MKFLLDTNICIHLIRQKTPQLIHRVTAMSPEGIGLSSISVAELQHGVMRSQLPEQNQAALDQFLLPFDILPFGRSAAVAYGEIRAVLERRGLAIGALDMLIAGHALSLGAVVVTNNVGEFSRVAGLTVEDWTAG